MIKSIIRNNRKFFIISVIISLVASLATLYIPSFSNEVFSNLDDLELNSIFILIGIMLLNYLLQIGMILFRENAATDQKIVGLKTLAPIFATKNLDTEILRNGENLSGGEKQRVAIACSLMKEADVYIFDEITSNLDDVSQVEFFNEMMVDLAGKIIFIISHDKSVEAFTNKILPL